jgi:hypothetical protein
MEAIGLLASGLAHDFNNTLTVAVGFAALIQAEATDSQVRTDAEAIVTVVEKARELTRRLLAVARDTGAPAAPTDVRNVIVNLVPLLRQAAGPAVEVDLALQTGPDRLPRRRSARTGPDQSRGERPGRDARRRDADDRRQRGWPVPRAMNRASRSSSGTPGRNPGRHAQGDLRAVLHDETERERVGPRLAMVGGFAARAGGEISVRSEVGKGTAFVIRVPEVRPPARRQDRTAGGGTSPRRRVGRRVKAMQPSGAHFQARPG